MIRPSMLLASCVVIFATFVIGCTGVRDVSGDPRYCGTYRMGTVYQTKTLFFLRADGTVWHPDFGGVPSSLEAFRTNGMGTWSDTTGPLSVGTHLKAEHATVARFGGTVGRPVRVQARVLDGELAGRTADLMNVSGSDYSRELGVSLPLVSPDVLEESK